jgi:hypothetical protein
MARILTRMLGDPLQLVKQYQPTPPLFLLPLLVMLLVMGDQLLSLGKLNLGLETPLLEELKKAMPLPPLMMMVLKLLPFPLLQPLPLLDHLLVLGHGKLVGLLTVLFPCLRYWIYKFKV